MALSLLLGILIGTVMGLTGAGGGILGVPALVMSMGWTMQQAAPVALIAVAIGALVGTVQGLRKKQVRYRAASLMVLFAIPMTAIGYQVAGFTPQSILMIIFAAVMVLIAFRLFNQANRDSTSENLAVLCRINPVSGQFIWSWPVAIFFAGLGGFTGFLTGLLGVGGGFLIVPLLRRYTNASMHVIVATSLMFIALVGSASVVSAIYHDAQLSLYPTIGFSVTTIIGVILGRKLASYLPASQVQKIFAVMLVITAVIMLIKALV